MDQFVFPTGSKLKNPQNKNLYQTVQPLIAEQDSQTYRDGDLQQRPSHMNQLEP